jgi:ABC-type proline/glycine betaine transport system permease subunit
MPKKKDGTKITWKEFFKLWGDGIKNLTPLQKISNELNSSITSLIGFVVCLVVLIIFRERLIVNWFAYGLILIFAGNTWGTTIKCIGLYQQKKIFVNIEKQINGEDDESD